MFFITLIFFGFSLSYFITNHVMHELFSIYFEIRYVTEERQELNLSKEFVWETFSRKKLNWTDWVKQIYNKQYSQNSTIFNYNTLKLRLTLEGWKMLNSIKYELGSDFRYTFKSSSFFFSGTTSILSAFSLSLTIYIVYIFIGSKYSSETYFHVNFRFFLQQKWQCHLYSFYLFVYSLTVKSHVHTSSSSFSCEEKYTSGNILYNSISIINTLELLWLPHIHKWSWAIRGWLQKVG